MSTDDIQNQQNTPIQVNPNQDGNDSGQALSDLADTLSSVNPKAPDAEVNATSISDNNGGRIELNQEKTNTRADAPLIKK